ncbi:hypothetical protein MKW94_004809 [Papaver nudicaule]|uniref:PHD and RING finger domain-containing protein 1 n=1 Tax=Papaver nudicaule TaxID=74823 RepID=A0AA41RZA0_PAPNU|nr:hypothetical protein [Papaver nudicaule]
MENAPEYTIESLMEETQQPQQQEACDDIEFPSSPNTRQKLTSESPNSKSKGKEKIVEEERMDWNESEDNICGICFSEEDGKSIKGSIDSCNHYFCFVCIMEWSKCESRCPLCKQRFNTIIRPPKDELFINQRVVDVPTRDQVWHPLGNVSTGPSDPHARTNCAKCQSSLDENLLLLCDLCDSAAHTYCVGLGSTVPEGNWYCHDCTLCMDNHCNGRMDNHCNSQHDIDSGDRNLEAGESVSISEIVRETYLTVPNRDIGGEIKVTDPNVRHLIRSRDVINPQNSPTTVTRKKINAGSMVTDSSMKIACHRRDVQSHVKIFRENWDALRNGSLQFSSNYGSRKEIKDKTTRSQSSSCLQNTNTENVAGKLPNKRNCYDTDKAWKMLDIAQSVKRAREGKATDCVSTHRFGKRNTQADVTGTISNSSRLEIKSPQQKDLSGFASDRCNGIIACTNPKSPSFEKEKLFKHAIKETSKCQNKGPSIIHASKYCGLSIPKQVNHTNKRVRIDAVVSPNKSFHGLSELPNSRSDGGASSSCKAEPLKESCVLGRTSASVTPQADCAKSEIQTLVKLNMKQLSKRKILGINEFKKIAKVSTHTILAACGLEHSKSSVHRPYPHLACSHTGTQCGQQLQRSDFVHSSCTECFHNFVKDVVNSILTEKGVPFAHSNS